MNSFTTPLILRFLDTKDDNRFEVFFPFTYRVKRGDKICVPKGFKTDFASIPRLFWRILPPIGLYGKAAVVHDYLYRNGLRTRQEADHIFLDAMKALGVSKWKRATMFRGVRMFGMFSYKKDNE